MPDEKPRTRRIISAIETTSDKAIRAKSSGLLAPDDCNWGGCWLLELAKDWRKFEGTRLLETEAETRLIELSTGIRLGGVRGGQTGS